MQTLGSQSHTTSRQNTSARDGVRAFCPWSYCVNGQPACLPARFQMSPVWHVSQTRDSRVHGNMHIVALGLAHRCTSGCGSPTCQNFPTNNEKHSTWAVRMYHFKRCVTRITLTLHAGSLSHKQPAAAAAAAASQLQVGFSRRMQEECLSPGGGGGFAMRTDRTRPGDLRTAVLLTCSIDVVPILGRSFFFSLSFPGTAVMTRQWES